MPAEFTLIQANPHCSIFVCYSLDVYSFDVFLGIYHRILAHNMESDEIPNKRKRLVRNLYGLER